MNQETTQQQEQGGVQVQTPMLVMTAAELRVKSPASPAAVRMTTEEYFAAPGLSNSAMKDLAVSPLRFWHKHINPNRPKDKPTAEMEFGSALHAAVLEPDKLDERYCCELDKSAYPDLLITMEDLKGWLSEHGHSTTAKRKQELVDRVSNIDPSVPILEVLEARHEAEHAGKVRFSLFDWQRLGGAAQALRSEPMLQRILSQGEAEVCMFARDPETGVLLKSRLDFVTSTLTLDLKTFAQKRGKSIDKSVADAIWYEGYHLQGYFYSMVRRLQSESRIAEAGEFVLAFVESEEPHEVRIKALRPKTGGNVNLYWEVARSEIRKLIRLYAGCLERFGDKPWRYAQEVTPLADEELPAGLSY